MPSQLRLQSSFEPFAAEAKLQSSPTLPPAKKQKMSLSQTYYVASTARTKLGREAGRADHDLRLLVGHANLLDSLMIELADAEREQEAWFNLSVNKASTPEQPQHVRWTDSIAEEQEDYEDDSDLDSDSGSDIYEEDDQEIFNIPLRKIRSPPVEITSEEVDSSDDEDMDYDDEFDEHHALERVPSAQYSPPELTLDTDSESDDESMMPTSPEQSLFELSEKQREQIATTNFYHHDKSTESLLAQQHQQPMIAAC